MRRVCIGAALLLALAVAVTAEPSEGRYHASHDERYNPYAGSDRSLNHRGSGDSLYAHNEHEPSHHYAEPHHPEPKHEGADYHHPEPKHEGADYHHPEPKHADKGYTSYSPPAPKHTDDGIYLKENKYLNDGYLRQSNAACGSFLPLDDPFLVVGAPSGPIASPKRLAVTPALDAKPNDSTFCASDDAQDAFGCYTRATGQVKVACSNLETPVAVNCGCFCSSDATGTDQTAMGACRTVLDKSPPSLTYGLPLACQARCVDKTHTAFAQATCSNAEP